MAGQALAARVSCTAARAAAGDGAERAHVVVLDYGVKGSIVRILREAGARVTVLPWDATAERGAGGRARRRAAGQRPRRPGGAAGLRRRGARAGRQRPVFGICLGHQLLGRALGLETFKLRFGHRGANHPVLELDTGRVLVTAQNHGFAVRGAGGRAASSRPTSGRPGHARLALRRHRRGARPARAAGRLDAVPPRGQPRAARRPRGARAVRRRSRRGPQLPRRDDIHTVAVIGSGPIVIGQACEFDYSGIQALRVLREEGYGRCWSTRTRPRS